MDKNELIMRKITLTALGLLFILSASAQYLYSVTDGSDPKDLSYTFSLYNTSNGKLPQGVSDMARGVAVDSMGRIWMGTDNGLVCREKENVKKFNYTNSPLVNTPYDRELTYTIFSIIADRDNGVWINQGWDLFRVKDDEWTRFDTLNSPVYWGRELFVDKENNFWITSWDGICKYDGTLWTVFDSTNMPIPSNKVLSFYIDNQDRIWVGTFSGNAMYDGEKWIDLKSDKTPLGKKCISEAYQDASGNMWFAFFSDRSEHKGGLYMLDTKGKWHHYAPKWTKSMERESANDMLYDESRDQIWIAVNTVGLFMYDVRKDKWEVYTTENSNLPSPYVMELCQDKEHHIWGATFGGFFMVTSFR
jgi:ligand-binding sensor domain-containing protein